jgi:hypothetical protein
MGGVNSKSSTDGAQGRRWRVLVERALGLSEPELCVSASRDRIENELRDRRHPKLSDETHVVAHNRKDMASVPFK